MTSYIVRKEQIGKAEEKECLEKEKEEKMKSVAEDEDEAVDKFDDSQKDSSEASDDNKIGLSEEPSRDQVSPCGGMSFKI